MERKFSAPPLYSFVVPAMNEEGNIAVLSEKIIEVMAAYGDFEIIFINDGSTDNTLAVLEQLHEKDSRIKYLSFSRNFGHQHALKAGLDYAKGDCVISLDADLQHPPELIPALIDKWKNENYDIVYTVRRESKKVGLFKRTTSRFFYGILNYMADITIDPGSADFRLLDRTVVDVIKSFRENPLFFRGVIPWLGFRQFAIEYMPHERFWGVSKYSVRKMFAFALNGILSFSVKPLFVSIYLGILISLFSFGYGIVAIYEYYFTEKTVAGWTSTLVIVSFIGGVQLIVMGIIGIYLGKLFMEMKSRPPYIIREKSGE